jgi:hypothetical protein
MATRKALCLVSGLFEEVNTPTDKLDFAGNSTTDLAEGTNLYYTNTRARQSISVTDSGGDGSLSYDNSTGVITYTGPSASEVRAHFSAANSGTGFGSLAYSSLTGTFTYSVVTAANIRQQISVTDTGGDGSLSYDNTTGVITYTGPSASEVRSHFSVAAGSGLTYSSITGEFGTNAIPNSQLANSSITFGSTSTSLGGTITALSITSYTASSFVNVGNGSGSAGSINIEPGAVIFEGSTADGFETTLQVVDPTADRTITFPDAGGTVALLTSLSVAAGSGLTYNSTTGEFGTSNIPNSQLQNSSITVGSTAIALGSSSTTLAGLTSLTSTGITTNDSGFRIRNTTDITKQIAFDASVITTGTTRTYTLPDASGTVALLTSLSVAAGSGLTYNNTTGEFGTSNIPNSQLQNSSITVGSTSIALGATSTTLAGLTSLTSTGITTNDSGFRIRDDSDNTKQLAFECSGITTATTRTMTVPDESGTISTQDFATAIAIALG